MPAKTSTPLRADELWDGDQSPTVKLLRARYRRLGLDQWSNKRVVGLARVFRVTVPELCAFAGLFRKIDIERYWKKDRWPIAVALHFAVLETLWAERRGIRSEMIRDENVMKAFLENAAKKDNHAKA